MKLFLVRQFKESFQTKTTKHHFINKKNLFLFFSVPKEEKLNIFQCQYNFELTSPNHQKQIKNGETKKSLITMNV